MKKVSAYIPAVVNVFAMAIMLVLMLMPVVHIYAQGGGGQGLVPCDGIHCKLQDLCYMLVNVYNWLLGMAGLVALLFIVFGGVRMIWYSYFAELPNQEEELGKGKLTVTRAIFGLLVVAVAYLLVNTLLVDILLYNKGGIQCEVSGS